jgi:tetratricopeptide (TPR) repeat protein
MGAASVLGEVFARIAEELIDPAARARHWLLAAEARARGARDAIAAQRALDRAREAGIPTSLGLRIARALAHSIGDRSWYDAATRELVDADPDPDARTRLTLELLRSALLRFDQEEIAKQRAALAAAPEQAYLSSLLGAYGSAPSERVTDLLALAQADHDPRRALAKRWIAALERGRAGAQGEALDALRALHEQHPEDAVIAGTLSGWLGSSDDRSALQALLRRAAQRVDDAALAASLSIEAGLTSFRTGERLLAIGDFESAEHRSPGSAGALEAWARRACRRFAAVVDQTTTNEAEQVIALLERLATPGGAEPVHPSLLERALTTRANALPPALATAANLAHLLFVPPPNGRADAPSFTLSQHPDQAELAAAWAYFAALGRADEASLLEQKARAWADLNPSLVPALEWFGATVQSGNAPDEWRARRLLAELLPKELGALIEASASLVRYIASGELPPLVDATKPELALVNLELAPPGCDPRRRSLALERTNELLGEEEGVLASLLLGYNQLALGERAAAAASFLRYANAFPDDPMGWEGLLSTTDDESDPVLVAEATAALGNATTDPAYGAQLFERAADILVQRLEDAVASEAALARAVELDITRRSSFDKLLVIMKKRGDGERLLDLIERRLNVTEDGDERALLLWERARNLRQSGDTAGATVALTELTVLRPDHVGALMLLGEIHVTDQRYAEAADQLARIAALATAPLSERLASGIAAVDLFENKLDASARAFEVLLALQSAGLGTLAVRERLARAAAKTGAWDEAALVLEQLMFERETADERSEAARLALAIHRDQRKEPARAARATEVLLALSPDDPEALEIVLGGSFDPGLSERLLKQGRAGLLSELQYQPIDVERVRLLARVAERARDLPLRQVSLGALVALGQATPSVLAELAELDQRLRHTPEVAIDAEWLQRLREPDDTGPIPELLQSFAPELVRALGPLPATFNAARKNRVAPGSGLPLRNDVAAWAGAFQLGDFELHIADLPPGRVRALGTEPPTLIAGPGVESPLGPEQRLDLVREIYALERGIGFVLHYEASDVAALIVALLELDGPSLSAPHYARLDDFKRQLARALNKSERKALAARAGSLRIAHADIARWVEACVGTLDRIAALAVGDPSWVVAQIETKERGDTRDPGALSARTRRIMAFTLSATFAELREKLGMTRR